MFDLRTTHLHYVALCNLLRKTHTSGLLLQAAEYLADVYQADAALIYLLDSSGQRFELGGGRIIGNANWAAKGASVQIDPMSGTRCPLVQVAITKRKIDIAKRHTAYDLSAILDVLPADLLPSSYSFLPLLRRDGSLQGAVALASFASEIEAGDDVIRTLSLESCAHLIEDRLESQRSARQAQEISKSLGTAAAERDRLKEVTNRQFERLLPGVSPAMGKLRAEIARLSKNRRPVVVLGRLVDDPNRYASVLHETSAHLNGQLRRISGARLSGADFILDLIGHQRGSVTGVSTARKGVLREAAHGTVFVASAEALDDRAFQQLIDCMDTGVFRPVGAARDIDATFRFVIHLDPNDPVGLDRAKQILDTGLASSIQCPSLENETADIVPFVQHVLRDVVPDQDIFVVPDLALQLQVADMPMTHVGLRNQIKASLNRLVDGVTLTAELFATNYGHDNSNAKSVEDGAGMQSDGTFAQRLAEFEKSLISTALMQHNGNRAAAAQQLNLPKRTLADRCKKYGL